MARSDEAAAFFHAVYSAVQEIPHGKVTSYGHIAKLVGTREYQPTQPVGSVADPWRHSPAPPPGRGLPEAPPPRRRLALQQRQRPLAEGRQLQGGDIAQVGLVHLGHVFFSPSSNLIALELW